MGSKKDIKKEWVQKGLNGFLDSGQMISDTGVSLTHELLLQNIF